VAIFVSGDWSPKSLRIRLFLLLRSQSRKRKANARCEFFVPRVSHFCCGLQPFRESAVVRIDVGETIFCYVEHERERRPCFQFLIRYETTEWPVGRNENFASGICDCVWPFKAVY
jgi:hypothetical protein